MIKRFIAALVVLGVLFLFVTGIVSVDFENGRAHFSFNKERAKEVEERAVEKIHELQDDDQGLGDDASDAIHSLVGHEKSSSWSGLPSFGVEEKQPAENKGLFSNLKSRFESQ